MYIEYHLFFSHSHQGLCQSPTSGERPDSGVAMISPRSACDGDTGGIGMLNVVDCIPKHCLFHCQNGPLQSLKDTNL